MCESETLDIKIDLRLLALFTKVCICSDTRVCRHFFFKRRGQQIFHTHPFDESSPWLL